MTTSSLQESIAAARAAAGAAAPTAAGVPAPVAATAAAVPAVAGQRMGLSQFMDGGQADADGYIKIGETGVKFGTSLIGFDGLRYRLEVGKDVRFFQVVSFGNNPATYLRSVDGITCQEGGTWQQALLRAQSVDPKAKAYESAELVFTLLEDAINPKNKSEVIAAEGTRWAYSTPKTGSAKFRRLLKEVMALGIDVETADIEIKIGGEPKAKNGLNWNEVTFELVGEYAEAGE